MLATFLFKKGNQLHLIIKCNLFYYFNNPCYSPIGRINCTHSVFWYKDVTTVSCDDYVKPDFRPVFEVDFGTDAAKKAKAEDICKDSANDRIKDTCIYDYFMTGNEELAAATASSQNTVQEVASVLGMLHLLHLLQ